MLMVGFNGQTLDKSDLANPIYSQIKDLGIGGVILFNQNADKTQPKLVKNIQNPEQVRKLISDLQEVSRIPLFVAIDQEGGRVSRLSPAVFGVSPYSAKYLGTKHGQKITTYSEALKTAKVLKDLGFNVNFAPVTDLDINKNSHIISKLERAYSDDPNVVIKQARQVILAHNKYGVLPVIKHFPGHGSAAGDTHLGFVDVTKTYSEKELVPYKTLVAEKMRMGVMSAHVFNSNFDPKFPASLSEKTVTGLLKNKLGFSGLIFTDDIQMRALKDNYSFEQTLLQAVMAGNDVIVIGNNLNYEPESVQKAVDTIFKSVKAGQIKQERIDESYRKIMRQKGF
jgi:beta-N-acetylhexosaminidase